MCVYFPVGLLYYKIICNKLNYYFAANNIIIEFKESSLKVLELVLSIGDM